MVFLDSDIVCTGRNCGIFDISPEICIDSGTGVLRGCFFGDPFYHRAYAGVWRPDLRLAFSGLHHYACERGAAFVYGNHRTIHGKDLS